MNQHFVANMTHFLDDKGAIPGELPEAARKFAEGLGKIVACVTSQSRESARTDVHCWSEFRKKPCNGKIDAVIELKSLDILWKCSLCGDQGLISHWEKTFWDCRYR